MQHRRTHTNKREGIISYLLLLTGFFFLLEFSFFLQCNSAYLSDYTYMSSHMRIPMAIIPGILFLLIAQVALHLTYCFFICAITRLVGRWAEVPSKQLAYLAMGLWMLGIATILAANQYLFPNSKFSELTALIISRQTAHYLWMVLAIIWSFLLAIAMVSFLRKRSGQRVGLIAVIPLVVLGYASYKPVAIGTDFSTIEKPNIIIIGVDSLRPDFLSYFGSDMTTPFFDSFLNQATVFGEAVTPIARTFPAWASLLTGEYPRLSGLRTDLAQQSKHDYSASLPAILKRNGYETMYATDETRFSNIDKNIGFDEIVTPPMGLNDFLIGTFNDFPLSNLIINSTLGHWLFPYNYANRAAYFSYDPNSFLNLMKQHLNESRTQPLFLAVHFCLPHNPYTWSKLPARDYKVLALYQQGIVRADQQLHDFFTILNDAHLLDHAIVVMLSDHGEALEMHGDRLTEAELYDGNQKTIPRFYPPTFEEEAFDQSAGHGTDVLGLTQYHILLAYRLYGLGTQYKGLLPGVVSLLSIKPTILQLLALDDPAAHCVPGTLHCQTLASSLYSLITSKHPTAVTYKQHLFLESDFSPEALRTVYPKEREVMLEGIELYQIDPKTTLLTVRDKMDQMIINSKQYADIYGDWMLAIYPQAQNWRMPILINLNTGQWTNDLHSNFAKHSPANQMLIAMQDFFGKEVNGVKLDGG